MTSSTLAATSITTLIGGILLVAWRLHRRIHIGEDFVLARRRLPAALTGLSQAVNCIPLWLTMALALLAYSMGFAAVWMALALLFGMVVNWWLIAPYLRSHTAATGSETLSKWFASSAGDNLQQATLRSSAAIVVFSLGLGSLTCLQWAAQYFAPLIGSNFTVAVAFVTLTVLGIALLAGLWSASAGDAVQATLILIALGTLAVGALFAVDDWQSLVSGLMQSSAGLGRKSRGYFGGYSGVLAISLVVGMVFAGFGGAAQPHAISRYLACRDDATLRRARWIALAWCALTLLCALVIGWCARALLHSVPMHSAPLLPTSIDRTLLLTLADQTLPGALASIAATCIAVALALSCASPWVAIATHVVTDLSSSAQSLSLFWCRIALVVIGLSVGSTAMYFPIGNEDRLWLCWQSLSAAFGPLLLVRLTGKKVRPGSSLGAMWSGFVLTVLFHLMPDTPGDLLERTLPFIAALGIALSGGERRRNPDRADRGDRTVHDHLPI